MIKWVCHKDYGQKTVALDLVSLLKSQMKANDYLQPSLRPFFECHLGPGDEAMGGEECRELVAWHLEKLSIGSKSIGGPIQWEAISSSSMRNAHLEIITSSFLLLHPTHMDTEQVQCKVHTHSNKYGLLFDTNLVFLFSLPLAHHPPHMPRHYYYWTFCIVISKYIRKGTDNMCMPEIDICLDHRIIMACRIACAKCNLV